MAKIARAWAPFFAIVLPAVCVAATGALVLAAKAGWEGPFAPALSGEMSRAAAAGVVLAGVGLIASYRSGRLSLTVRYACAALVALIATGEAALTASGVDLGARASAPAIAALLITAVLLTVFDRPRGRLAAVAVQLLIGLLLAVALVSLIAVGVDAEGLLPGYRFSRMPEMTAATFLGIAISLLALLARARWYETVYEGREDEKILILVLGILTLVAVAMGAAAFVGMQRNLDRALRGTLANAVNDRAAILDNVVANRVTRASIVATRPAVVVALRQGAATLHDRLREEAESLLGAGFSGVAFDNAGGTRLAEAGEIVEYPALEVPLAATRAPASLIFSDGFLLRVRTPIRDGDRVVGSVTTEQPLDLLLRFQLDVPEIGESAEWVLCGARDDQSMACFPRRTARRPEALARRHQGESLPMDYALAGGSGVIIAHDYHGDRVVAGFSPVARTGLGVVLKMRLEEFYAPLRRDLGTWWRWYFAVALAAALLVASQVRPVAQRLVQSERMARDRSEALGRSERGLRELYASLGDGIVVLAPDGTIEFANPAAERLFGYPAGGLAGRPVATLIPPEMRDANARATQRFLESGHSGLVGEKDLVFSAVRRNGSRFDLEFSLATMGQEGDLRLVGVLRDVSQRTALERLKRDFVATVSHELRTPLTSIMGSLELLREADSLEGPEREMLDMAWRNSGRLARLVNDVIDAERLDSGTLQFASTRFALDDFLRDAVRLDQGYASARGVALRLEEPVPVADLEVDRDRLMQVMGNLVSNASKFSPAGAEVTIAARAEAMRVRIEVMDRGRGIPDEFRARIFERFAQADASDARDKGGTGLGLAICKQIVERMQGAIGFEDREGGGTTFWVELPRA